MEETEEEQLQHFRENTTTYYLIKNIGSILQLFGTQKVDQDQESVWEQNYASKDLQQQFNLGYPLSKPNSPWRLWDKQSNNFTQTAVHNSCTRHQWGGSHTATVWLWRSLFKLQFPFPFSSLQILLISFKIYLLLSLQGASQHCVDLRTKGKDSN